MKRITRVKIQKKEKLKNQIMLIKGNLDNKWSFKAARVSQAVGSLSLASKNLTMNIKWRIVPGSMKGKIRIIVTKLNLILSAALLKML